MAITALSGTARRCQATGSQDVPLAGLPVGSEALVGHAADLGVWVAVETLQGLGYLHLQVRGGPVTQSVQHLYRQYKVNN